MKQPEPHKFLFENECKTIECQSIRIQTFQRVTNICNQTKYKSRKDVETGAV